MGTVCILVVLAAAALALAIFLCNRYGNWRHKKEVQPGLGEVETVYQHKKLAWCSLKKHGVLINILPQGSEVHQKAIEFVRNISAEEIDDHLRKVVAEIPEPESKAFGFDQGKWKVECITLNGDDSLIFDVANSSDQDHVCVISLERGKYRFEAIDG